MDWADVRLKARAVRKAAQGGDDMMATSTSVILKRAMRSHDLMLKRIGNNDVYVGAMVGVLHRRAKLVSIARGLPPERRRVVVAHELGHFHMHDDPRLALAKSNFSFDGRIGEGYCESELKEVQADVFAAEFLCPSDWLAEELRLDRRRPVEIAQRLGVPRGLIFSQAGVALLDGWKRPPRPTSQPVPPLRPDQVEAATWSGGHLIVQGAPSSGKTVTAAARITHLLQSNVPPASIAVLAHSDCLAARLLDMVPNPSADGMVQIWSGTLQAFAKEIVSTHPTRIGRTSAFRIVDDVAALSLLIRTGLLPTGDGYEGGRARRAAMRQIASEKNNHLLPQAGQTVGLTGLRHAYETVLRMEDAVDAADLIPFAIDLLERDRKVLMGFQKRYREIVVDDFEEMTPAGIALLRLLAGPDTRIFATGGAHQSIFRFKDSSPGAISDFETIFAGHGMLLRDRRTVIPSHSSSISDGRAADGAGRDGYSIEITVSADAAYECDRLAGKIMAWKDGGIALTDQVVLGRRHDVLKRIADGLKDRGIPVSFAGDHIRRPEILDLFAVAAIAASKDGAALSRLSRLYGASSSALRAMRCFRNRFESIGDLEVLRRLNEIKGISAPDRAILGRLGSDLLHAEPLGKTLDTVQRWLFEHSDYLLPSSSLRSLDATACSAIRAFLDVCEDHDAQNGSNLADLKARLGRMRSLTQDSRYRRSRNEAGDVDGVRLMTVHAAKGLHFLGAHVASMEEPPTNHAESLRSTIDDPETAISLTATTRGLERLHVFWQTNKVGSPDALMPRPVEGTRVASDPACPRRERRSAA